MPIAATLCFETGIYARLRAMRLVHPDCLHYLREQYQTLSCSWRRTCTRRWCESIKSSMTTYRKTPRKNSNVRAGSMAEVSAVAWLWEQGFEVFRNACFQGPADLVVWDKEARTIILVDVKVACCAKSRDGFRTYFRSKPSHPDVKILYYEKIERKFYWASQVPRLHYLNGDGELVPLPDATGEYCSEHDDIVHGRVQKMEAAE